MMLFSAAMISLMTLFLARRTPPPLAPLLRIIFEEGGRAFSSSPPPISSSSDAEEKLRFRFRAEYFLLDANLNGLTVLPVRVVIGSGVCYKRNVSALVSKMHDMINRLRIRHPRHDAAAVRNKTYTDLRTGGHTLGSYWDI